jgi:hypothetical protein
MNTQVHLAASGNAAAPESRPILFSAPMVRALLAGTKTQTRRPVKPQPDFDTARAMLGGDTSGASIVYDHAFGGLGLKRGNGTGFVQPNIRCPYGQPGDRLWVREAWAPKAIDPECTTIAYRATDDECNGPWKPSIHMPRWASRILLEVTEVRVQRPQEISHEDAEQEGVKCDMSALGFRDHFAALWDRINGCGSWDANPWVWVVSFKRITP